MTDASELRTAAEELVVWIKRFQDAVDLFDTAAAEALDINATDLRCMTALRDRGPMKASAVATQLGLSRGATTTALDRLEKKTYVARRADLDDGRGVIIELTDRGRGAVDAIWTPMRRRGGEHLRSYSLSELQLLIRFFQRSVELQLNSRESLATSGAKRREPAARIRRARPGR